MAPTKTLPPPPPTYLMYGPLFWQIVLKYNALSYTRNKNDTPTFKSRITRKRFTEISYKVTFLKFDDAK